MAEGVGGCGSDGGTPPEMDKLLPSLPKEAIAEYSGATPTPGDLATGGETMIMGSATVATAEQRGPFCSPAPPPFPFSLSYSSKSESSGEKKSSGKKYSRRKGSSKKRTSSRAKMADARTPPSASSASSSEATTARHPGQPSINCIQKDGQFQNPAEDPMFAALFASHGGESKAAANAVAHSYASPSTTKGNGDLRVGKVVTEEETSPPSDGANDTHTHLDRYKSHTETTPSRGVTMGASPYQHYHSPSHPYYQFPPPGQYFQSTGPGADDVYHQHQGYQGYDPYSTYAGQPPIDGGTIYDSGYPYNTQHDPNSGMYEYYTGPYPGDGYVGNHDEAFYQQLPGITDRSPGKVSYSSSHSHSPGATSHQTQTPKKRKASTNVTSVYNDSPYEAMPPLSTATPVTAGSPLPAKKQRVLSSAWADRFIELLEYKKANGECLRMLLASD